MALHPAQFETFMAHLRKHMRSDVCPVCRSHAWSASQLVAPLVAITEDDGDGFKSRMGPEFVPMALLVCKTCGYVMHFAWRPIQEASRGK